MKKKLTQIELNEIQHFDFYSDKYDSNYNYNDKFTKYKLEKKADKFIDLVKKKYGNKKIKILEIGTGTGEYTKRIAEKLPNALIIGLDISPKILSVAKRKCKKLKNAKFVSRSAYDTKYTKQKFDIVFGFYILHHLESEKVAKEIKRILKPGGLVYFYEPNILNPIVYLIKSNKYLKDMVGDSKDEWAINPLKVEKDFKGFRLEKNITTEFLPPISFLSLKTLKSIDKVSAIFSYLPLLRLFGGSVELIFTKK